MKSGADTKPFGLSLADPLVAAAIEPEVEEFAPDPSPAPPQLSFDYGQVRRPLVDLVRDRAAFLDDDAVRSEALSLADSLTDRLGLDEAGRLQVIELAEQVLAAELDPVLDYSPVWGPGVHDHQLAEAL